MTRLTTKATCRDCKTQFTKVIGAIDCPECEGELDFSYDITKVGQMDTSDWFANSPCTNAKLCGKPCTGKCIKTPQETMEKLRELTKLEVLGKKAGIHSDNVPWILDLCEQMFKELCIAREALGHLNMAIATRFPKDMSEKEIIKILVTEYNIRASIAQKTICELSDYPKPV